VVTDVAVGSGGSSTIPRRARLAAYWRLGRWAIFAAALLYCVLAVTGTVPYGDTPEGQIVMADGAAFYFLNEPPYDWTDRPPGVAEFRYSPAFLWVTAPLRLLPWAAFAAVWFSAHIVVLIYLRVPWMLAFPGVVDDVVRGNINLFIALVIVLVVRHRTMAALWATILLTKVTPGIGVIWHAAVANGGSSRSRSASPAASWWSGCWPIPTSGHSGSSHSARGSSPTERSTSWLPCRSASWPGS
jgi:hypothetical protein